MSRRAAGAQRARAARLAREQRHRDETADPATLTDSDLWSGIYRLQGRRYGDWSDRIRALMAEQDRRKEISDVH